jgi:Calcineurin-like phosphoesterase
MTDQVHWQPEATTGFERGSGPWRADRRFDPQPKVRWLALAQLARTGVHVVVSKLFGQYNDRRETFAFASGAVDDAEPTFFDHSDESTTCGGSRFDPYWFDFVSDTGDGFNAVYAVAEQLAQEQFVVGDEREPDDDTPATLPRGRLLIMGGDEVYPIPTATAERGAYRDRFAGPYEAALEYLGDPNEPPDSRSAVAHLYAIPGNHDWYDGLGAFIKQFCSENWIGGWKTRQRRSYFAVELPHHWWIWGIDVAFGGPVDEPQLRYFKEAADQVLARDGRIILVTAYPRWLAPDEDGRGSFSVIRGFLHRTLKEEAWRVRLMLSGDSHFYARHSPALGADGSVKIVAGGGGAYLSGTQALEPEVRLLERRGAVGPTTYGLDTAWPPQHTARGALAWSALVRIWRHWSFSLLIAGLYLFAAAIARVGMSGGLSLKRTVGSVAGESWGGTFVRLAEGCARSAIFWIFVGILWFGLAGVALALQRGDKVTNFAAHWLWGFGHGCAHVAAVLAITATALHVAYEMDPDTFYALYYYAVVVAGGYVVGTLIFALYLVLAQRRKRSVWALFPLLAHEGWKNFLRIQVVDDAVTVYALGLQHVPTHRKVTWDDADVIEVSPATCEWRIIDRVEVLRGERPADSKSAPR